MRGWPEFVKNHPYAISVVFLFSLSANLVSFLNDGFIFLDRVKPPHYFYGAGEIKDEYYALVQIVDTKEQAEELTKQLRELSKLAFAFQSTNNFIEESGYGNGILSSTVVVGYDLDQVVLARHPTLIGKWIVAIDLLERQGGTPELSDALNLVRKGLYHLSREVVDGRSSLEREIGAVLYKVKPLIETAKIELFSSDEYWETYGEEL